MGMINRMFRTGAAMVLCIACTRAGARDVTGKSAKDGVLEGIQISSEQGAEYGEKVVSAYFIFRDNPSSYFYEIKRKPNRIIFEFFDAVKGSAPISKIVEPPIKNFMITSRQVDMNKEVKGLKPDMHNVLQVTFMLDHIPKINVSDEYSVISFTYKWSDFPTKIGKYVMKDGRGRVLLWSLAGVSAVAGGVAAYILTQAPADTATGPQPLSIEDLPSRPY